MTKFGLSLALRKQNTIIDVPNATMQTKENIMITNISKANTCFGMWHSSPITAIVTDLLQLSSLISQIS